jgi:hypothetical protein
MARVALGSRSRASARPILLAVDQQLGDCTYDLGTNGKGNELIPAFRSGESRSTLNR